MEKPKCKLCGERHWGICPTPVEAFWRENHPIAKPSEGDFADPPREEVVPVEPTKPIVAPPPVVRAKADRSGAYPKPAMFNPVAGGCPYCDRNRAKALERVKRHREKRKED